MDLYMLFIIILSVVATIMTIVLIFGSYLMFNLIRKRKNPYDIIILEANKEGLIRARREIGRRVLDHSKGWTYITIQKMRINKIKDHLGQNFSDNNILPMGNRKLLIVVGKDNVFAPFERIINIAKKDKNSDFTKEEIEVLEKLKAKNINIVESILNPVSLSLNPMRQDNMRFELDALKDAYELYASEKEELAKSLIKWAAIIFGIAVIGVIVIIILLLMKGGDFAHSVQPVAQVVAQNVTTAKNLLPIPAG
jgi:hypothetical protein